MPGAGQKQEIQVKESTINFPLVTTVLSFCAFIIVCNVYTMIPIIEELSQFFHTTKLMMSWTTSSFTLCYAIGFLIFGPLSDRFGRWKIMVYGIGTLSLVTLAISFVESVQLLIILRALQGFAAGSFAPVALSFVFDIFPQEKRTVAIAWISTGFLTSGIMGQVFSSWITRTAGWSYVFVFFSMIYFVSFLAAWRILPNLSPPATNVRFGMIAKQMVRALFDPGLLKGYLIAFSLFFGFVGMYASLGGYLSQDYGLTDDQILGIRSLGIFGMLLSPLSSSLTKRLGLKKTLSMGLIAADLGLIMEWVSPSLVPLVFSTVLFVAGFSIVIPVMIQVIGVMGGKIRNSAVTLYTFILFVGASFGPYMIQIDSFKLVCLILTGVMSLSVWLSFKLNIPD